jgi:flagellar hook-associated protein 1 FlgK
MPGPFHGINLASNALRSFQRGLDVAGHNIANVNTRGYSRQTVDFVQSDPTTFTSLKRLTLGTGVGIESINRIRDLFLDARMQETAGSLDRFGTLSTGVRRLEAIYQEPGELGVSAALDRFFDAWSGLASNPSERAARVQAQQAGQTLANRVRDAYGNHMVLRDQFEEQTHATIREIDRLAGEIALLNTQIRDQRALGMEPNDLMDLRDLALEQLGSLINIKTARYDDGTVGVFVSQFTLVDRVGSRSFPSDFDPHGQTVSDGTRTYAIRSGRLLGLFESISHTTRSMNRLDLLANNLRAEVNLLHFSGVNENGTTGVVFFNGGPPPYPPIPNTMSGAIDFDLSADIKTDPDNIAAGTSGNAGDGGLALLLSRLREQPILNKTNGAEVLPGFNGRTFAEYYRDNLAEIAETSRFVGAARETQVAIADQIERQRQAVSGVSLDDEMATMLRFQRSYQAAARALTVFDQVTEDLIGMLRR